MMRRLTTFENGKVGSAALENCIGGSSTVAYSMARRLCGDPAEAKELIQETAYKVLRNWDRYDSAKPFDKWFFSVMRNAFIDSRRRFETRRVISLDTPTDEIDGIKWEEMLCGSDETPLEHLEKKETIRAVRKALDGLGKELRLVVELCDIEGLRYDEIAKSLDIPVGTVRSRLARARKALRTQSPELAAIA